MIPKEDKKKLSLIVSAIENLKGEEITIIDMRERSFLADYVIIATCTSLRHMEAAAESVVFALRDEKYEIDHREGSGEASWVLLDYHDVLVNMFYAESRAFYNLDGLYKTAPQISLSDVSGEEDAES